MNITKLTITPITTDCKGFQIIHPDIKTATTMITERLSSNHSAFGESKLPARALRKIPKVLKGFVNPKSKVVKEQKFSTYI